MTKKVRVKTKRWGSSIGVIIPNEIVKEQMIRPGDELEIEITKETDIEKMFGALKVRWPAGITTQQIKDELKAGWGE